MTVTDTDGDSVPDVGDNCPETPAGASVEQNGCSTAQLGAVQLPATGGTSASRGSGQMLAIVLAAAVGLALTGVTVALRRRRGQT